jgi:hypothetical protein
MDQSTKDSIKGFTGALVLTALFLAIAAYVVSDDVKRATHPVYDPQGTCIVNCR